MMWRRPDHLVVGAGFFGAVVAERLADHGRKVLVVDRRDHIGGNSWSTCHPETGIEYHPYGLHVFHTSNRKVKSYIDRFGSLNGYRHRVLARVEGRCFPFPINLESINSFFAKEMTPAEARAYIAAKARDVSGGHPRNFEEKALSLLGKELYEAFIRGYTLKQWGRDPKHLPANIVSRLPVRFDGGRDYFQRCRWQGVPTDGYASLFSRMLNHKNIRVETGVDYLEVRQSVRPRKETVYTGPIDRYFDYTYGMLGWRSLTFQLETLPVKISQRTTTVNYPDINIPHTKVHEPKHLHPERLTCTNLQRTLIVREYPDDDSARPYYPVRAPEDIAMFKRYRELAAVEAPGTVFGGRLGNYAYLDMDMTIASALACAQSVISQ